MDASRNVHILPCRPGQVVEVTLSQDIDPTAPIGRFFAEGGIDIMISHADGGELKIAVTAHAGLAVQRHDPTY
jgi:hypothetical protein